MKWPRDWINWRHTALLPDAVPDQYMASFSRGGDGGATASLTDLRWLPACVCSTYINVRGPWPGG